MLFFHGNHIVLFVNPKLGFTLSTAFGNSNFVVKYMCARMGTQSIY